MKPSRALAGLTTVIIRNISYIIIILLYIFIHTNTNVCHIKRALILLFEHLPLCIDEKFIDRIPDIICIIVIRIISK